MNPNISSPTQRIKNRFSIPPLENGDRLTREEFHRRYEAMPENVRAELIKGVVYFRTTTTVSHAEANAVIVGLIGLYSINTFGTNFANHVSLVIDKKSESQPDAVLRIEENCGGKSWANEKDYLEGAPELVVEIASSSVSYDLHDKLELYEQKGVQEYIVWRVLDEQIDWFGLEDGKYKKFTADKQGIIESEVFPGLRLNVEAMLEDNLQKVSADLQKGLKSKKYKNFVKQLTNKSDLL